MDYMIGYADEANGVIPRLGKTAGKTLALFQKQMHNDNNNNIYDV